jgi:cyclopropane-fatty-acyl-phospholipid synthase
MSSQKRQGEELEGDITFIATPAAVPSKFATGEDCGVQVTTVSPIELH